MALQSMTALASITLQEASASVTFSGIPQNYRDLVLETQTRTVSGTDLALVRFNGQNTGYSTVLMRGNGSDAVSSTGGGVSDSTFINYSTEPTATVSSTSIMNILDYSATDKHKTALVRGDNASDATEALVSRLAIATAINTILIQMGGGLSFATGSTFDLYGRIA
jgi:hypothetical protein